MDDALFAVADGHIVFDFEILHALDETTLNISGLGSIADLKAVGETEIECRGNCQIIHLGVECGVHHRHFNDFVEDDVVEGADRGVVVGHVVIHR